jgi:hypothetical protein
MAMKDPYRALRSELVGAAAREGVAPARRHPSWWHRRPRPLVVVLAVLVTGGSAAAAVVSLAGSSSQPLAGQVPGRITTGSQPGSESVAGFRYTIRVTPALSAGSAGWTTSISYFNPKTGMNGGGESGGGGYPTATDPVFQGGGMDVDASGQRGDTVAFAVTGPGVAAVRIGARTIRTFASPQLPTGDRAAVFFLPAGSPQPMIGLPPGAPLHYLTVPGPYGRHRVAIEAVVPLDKDANPIPTRVAPADGFVSGPFWQAPSAVTKNIHEPAYHGRRHPAPGVCELAQHGLPGLTPEWGRTITRLSPVQDSVGELFESCIATEYYLRGTPLSVGVLLDARHPGHTLDPLPDTRPVSGNRDLVDYGAADLSARRIGNAWLVVQGGSGRAQRLEVLQALRISRLSLR